MRVAPGDSSGVVPPVPIPNTVVKRSSADDTEGETPLENRSLPGAKCNQELKLLALSSLLFKRAYAIIPIGTGGFSKVKR